MYLGSHSSHLQLFLTDSENWQLSRLLPDQIFLSKIFIFLNEQLLLKCDIFKIGEVVWINLFHSDKKNRLKRGEKCNTYLFHVCRHDDGKAMMGNGQRPVFREATNLCDNKGAGFGWWTWRRVQSWMLEWGHRKGAGKWSDRPAGSNPWQDSYSCWGQTFVGRIRILRLVRCEQRVKCLEELRLGCCGGVVMLARMWKM